LGFGLTIRYGTQKVVFANKTAPEFPWQGCHPQHIVLLGFGTLEREKFHLDREGTAVSSKVEVAFNDLSRLRPLSHSH
jgi:hypothetical protein